MTKSITIINEILHERERQVTDEGYLTENDDKYVHYELTQAAISYSMSAIVTTPFDCWHWNWWPWSEERFKRTTPRRDLIKAAALLVAEIERLDRATDFGAIE